MSTTTNAKQVKMNIMTQQQYSTITPAATELYMVTDAELYNNFTGADGTNAGTSGLVPAPTATDDGKFLKGDGTWASVDALPSQTSQSGKFLTTDGTTASWAPISIPTKISDLTDDTSTYPVDKADTLTGLTTTVTELNYVDGVTSAIQTQLNGKQDTLVSGTNIKTINSTSLLGNGDISITGLPSQTSQSGKFLTTDGTTASWAPISTRNIGEIIQSTIPLTDAGLHLVDGTLLSGSGIYGDFVDYIADLYSSSTKYSNVTVVGSLTDNNGVLSGFSGSDYAVLQSVSLGSNFEILLKVTTGSDITSSNNLFNRVGATSAGLAFRVIEGVLSTYISSNGSSFDIANDVRSTLTFSTNTTYYIRVTYNGSTYLFDVSTDKTTWTNYVTISSTSSPSSVTPVLGVYIGSTFPWTGSIDLTESYIDINGERWWSGVQPSWATDEVIWQNSVTTYGVCGKFVYNSGDNTVRLPKITGFVEGTISPTILGSLTEAGLPNITGTLSRVRFRGNSDATGAFTTGSLGPVGVTDGTASVPADISFNASRSSSIYGNSSTVQPQAIKVLYYIVVATSVKTDIQVDIDEVVADLNDKVSKTGDTMTGNLTLQGNYEGSNQPIKIQDTNLVKGTAPTENHYTSVRYVDSNGDDLGGLQHRYLTGGSMALSLTIPSLTQEGTYNGLYAIANADGTFSTQAPTPASGDNSTKIATTAFVNTDFVKKSGDTMGWLNVTGALQKQGTNNPGITVKSTDFAYTDTPSANGGFGLFQIIDKNGDWWTLFGTEAYTDGRNLAKMQVRAKDGTSSRIQIWADSSNKFHCSFPMCTTKATTTSTASTGNIAAVTQNYLSGSSWYRVWSDGWIEQGGYVSSSTSTTVTLLKAFSNTNYTVAISSSVADTTGVINANNKIIINSSAAGSKRWYVCGY